MKWPPTRGPSFRTTHPSLLPPKFPRTLKEPTQALLPHKESGTPGNKNQAPQPPRPYRNESPHFRHPAHQNLVQKADEMSPTGYPNSPAAGGKMSCPSSKPQNCRGRKRKLEATYRGSAATAFWAGRALNLPLPPSPPQRAVKVSLNILENVKYTARCQLPKTIKLTLWTSRDFLEPVRGICLTSRRFLRSNFEIKPLSI